MTSSGAASWTAVATAVKAEYGHVELLPHPQKPDRTEEIPPLTISIMMVVKALNVSRACRNINIQEKLV